MRQRKIRAVFMRGGTSKALMFRRSDLPSEQADWAPIFLAAIGSPDPNGRQLDGMGGGISSLSKICVVGPATRPDADVDYTFAQVAVGSANVDYAGNCGNMSSAIGPFAVDEGLVPAPAGASAAVRIHNTNTGKIIVARFPMDGGMAAVDGDLRIDGVAGAGAPIQLDFESPGGARTGRLLPTGRAVDVVSVPGLGDIQASIVDAANPCVFVPAASLGLTGAEDPRDLDERAELLEQLEAIRRQASVAMGLASDSVRAGAIESVPKVAFVGPPAPSRTLAGQVLEAHDVDLLARMISVGQPHRAIPVTGGLCLAVACRIPGSVAWQQLDAPSRDGDLRIGHPSGILRVAADVEPSGDGICVHSATLYRTARRLFQGEVLYRDPADAAVRSPTDELAAS